MGIVGALGGLGILSSAELCLGVEAFAELYFETFCIIRIIRILYMEMLGFGKTYLLIEKLLQLFFLELLLL